jgi:hypothetical protein
VRFRPNRGIPLDLALHCHPFKFVFGLVQGARTGLPHFPASRLLSQDVDARAHRDRFDDRFVGDDVAGEATREAPVRAEPHPTRILTLPALFCPFGGGGIVFDQGNQVVGGRLHVQNIFLRDGGCVRQLLADLFQA